ncbi:MAG: hypothetical protein KDC57_08920 [Saprospiraceae bacterium]|nr:hypothetical protein [Saprospiraceae bacterium]
MNRDKITKFSKVFINLLLYISTINPTILFSQDIDRSTMKKELHEYFENKYTELDTTCVFSKYDSIAESIISNATTSNLADISFFNDRTMSKLESNCLNNEKVYFDILRSEQVILFSANDLTEKFKPTIRIYEACDLIKLLKNGNRVPSKKSINLEPHFTRILLEIENTNICLDKARLYTEYYKLAKSDYNNESGKIKKTQEQYCDCYANYIIQHYRDKFTLSTILVNAANFCKIN